MMRVDMHVLVRRCAVHDPYRLLRLAKAWIPLPHCAYAVSNHAYGIVESDSLAVQPKPSYDLRAWLRGEIDSRLVKASVHDPKSGLLNDLTRCLT